MDFDANTLRAQSSCDSIFASATNLSVGKEMGRPSEPLLEAKQSTSSTTRKRHTASSKYESITVVKARLEHYRTSLFWAAGISCFLTMLSMYSCFFISNESPESLSENWAQNMNMTIGQHIQMVTFASMFLLYFVLALLFALFCFRGYKQRNNYTYFQNIISLCSYMLKYPHRDHSKVDLAPCYTCQMSIPLRLHLYLGCLLNIIVLSVCFKVLLETEFINKSQEKSWKNDVALWGGTHLLCFCLSMAGFGLILVKFGRCPLITSYHEFF